MNQVTPEQKDSVTKTLAIVGFVAAILFAVWIAVQVVSIIPSAFSSLASIADGVYNYDEDQKLTVATKSSVVNTGEAFTLSWTEMSFPGSYTFSYKCTEGTSADVRNIQGDIVSLNCDTLLNLEDKKSLDIIINSEKQRFTDVTYTIVFTPKNESLNAIETNAQITIVNASISTYAEENDEKETMETSVPEGAVAGESTTDTQDGTQRSGLVAGEPTTIEEIIYAIPTSNPNGDVDLKITYLGVGILKGKTFKRAGTISIDDQGSFQFSVENIGTKTSDEWTFDALLPGGITYTSKTQTPLKPAEKSVITIGFEGLAQVGIERFGAELNIDDDVDTSNNKFNWAVEVVK